MARLVDRSPLLVWRLAFRHVVERTHFSDEGRYPKWLPIMQPVMQTAAESSTNLLNISTCTCYDCCVIRSLWEGLGVGVGSWRMHLAQ